MQRKQSQTPQHKRCLQALAVLKGCKLLMTVVMGCSGEVCGEFSAWTCDWSCNLQAAAGQQLAATMPQQLGLSRSWTVVVQEMSSHGTGCR